MLTDHLNEFLSDQDVWIIYKILGEDSPLNMNVPAAAISFLSRDTNNSNGTKLRYNKHSSSENYEAIPAAVCLIVASTGGVAIIIV